jgi:hypothetical protein
MAGTKAGHDEKSESFLHSNRTVDHHLDQFRTGP